MALSGIDKSRRDYYREFYNVCYKVDFSRNVFKIWDLDYEKLPLYKIEDDPLHTISLTALRRLDELHSNNLREPVTLEHLGFIYSKETIVSTLKAFDLATFKRAVLPWLDKNDHDAYERYMEVKANLNESVSREPITAFSKYMNHVVEIFVKFRNMPELPQIPDEAGWVRPTNPNMAGPVTNLLGLWPTGKIAVPQFGSHFDSWEQEILAELCPDCHVMEDSQGQFALKSRFVDLFGIISSCEKRIKVMKLMPVSDHCKIKRVNLQRKSPLLEVKRKSPLLDIERKSPLLDIERKSSLPNVKRKSPFRHIERKSSLLDVERKSALLDIERKSPLLDIERKSPLLDIERKSPLLDIERKSPLLDIERKSPLLDIERKSPLLDIERKSPLLDIKRKSSVVEIPNHTTHCHSSEVVVDSTDQQVTSSRDTSSTEAKRLTEELERLWMTLGCPKFEFGNLKKESGSPSVESVEWPSSVRNVSSPRMESQSPRSEIVRSKVESSSPIRKVRSPRADSLSSSSEVVSSRAEPLSPDKKVSSPENAIWRPKVEPESSTFDIERLRNYFLSDARQLQSISSSSEVVSSRAEPISPDRNVLSPGNAIGRPEVEPQNSTFDVESNCFSSLARQLQAPSFEASENSCIVEHRVMSPGEMKYPEAYAHVRKYGVKSFNMNGVSEESRTYILLGGNLGSKYNDLLSKRSRSRFMRKMPLGGGILEHVLETLVSDLRSYGKYDEAIMFAAGRIVACKAQFPAHEESNGEIYIQGLA